MVTIPLWLSPAYESAGGASTQSRKRLECSPFNDASQVALQAPAAKNARNSA